MFNLLLFLLIVICVFALAIVMNIVNAVFGIFRGIFSFGRKGGDTTYGHSTSSKAVKKKVFNPNDGEYVDYEEVKDK